MTPRAARAMVWLYNDIPNAPDRWAAALKIWEGNDWQFAKGFPTFAEAIAYADKVARGE